MKNLFKRRTKSRIYVLQSMYIWNFNNIGINKIKYNLLLNKNFNKIDVLYYDKLFFGILQNINLLDRCIVLYGKIKINSVNIIDLNIMRIAIFELIFCKFMPYKVILSESLFLSKLFCSDWNISFVNGVLNSVINEIKFFHKKKL